MCGMQQMDPEATMQTTACDLLSVLTQQIDQFGRLFDVAWPALEAQLKRTLQQGLTSCKWTRWENWSTDSNDVVSLQVRAVAS